MAEEKLKILQVYPTLDPTKGGVERYIEALVKYLMMRGHSVSLLCSSIQDAILYNGSFQTFLNPLLSLRQNFDVIHTHGFRVPFSVSYGIMSGLSGKKVIMTLHTIFPARSTFDATRKKIYDKTIGSLCLKLFDGFIVLIKEMADELQNLGVEKERIQLVPLSIDLDRFENLPDASLFLNSFGVPQDKDIILMVGRLAWQKYYPIAFKAFTYVSRELSDTVLVLIGKDWGYRRELEELAHKLSIDDRLYIVEKVDEQSLLSAYSASKLFLLSSVYEGFPTTLLEAMACCCPTLVLSQALSPSIISELNHTNASLIVKNAYPKAIAEPIINALCNKSLQRKLSQNGRVYVEKHHDWDKNIDKIIGAYQSFGSHQL